MRLNVQQKRQPGFLAENEKDVEERYRETVCIKSVDIRKGRAKLVNMRATGGGSTFFGGGGGGKRVVEMTIVLLNQ